MAAAQWGRAMDTAIKVVTDQVENLNSMSETYNGMLDAAMTALQDAAKPLLTESPPQLPGPPNAPSLISADGNLGGPTELPLDVNYEVLPLEIDHLLRDPDLNGFNPPNPPEAQPIVVPSPPPLAAITPPGESGIDTSVDFPAAPVLAYPTMQALAPVVIPAFTGVEIPDFTDAPPDAAALMVPNVFINWAEPSYQGEVLQDLVLWVKESMQGGTGLPPAVEDALFARARERDSAETNRAVQEAVDTWAARNFSMPPGMLVKQASFAREQGRLKSAELNRDVMVEAAKWEIENIRFAVQQGIALETMLSNLFENATKRLFEAARFQAEAQINVFNAQVNLFSAQNQAFQTLVQVYRAKIDGRIAKVTAFKAEVEAQAAVGQLNQQKVEQYKAEIGAVQTMAEVYSTQMRAAQVKADVIKSQIDAYRAEVQAYAEKLGAEKVKFDAYESQIKGETAKAGMFEAQARAYAATVQGMSAKAEVEAKGIQLRIEVARAYIQKYVADIDRYRADTDASLKAIQAGTEAFRAKADAWRASAEADIAAAGVNERLIDADNRTKISFAEMRIKQYQTDISKANNEAQMALEAAKAMGQYSAQLAAGAMSALHVSAAVDGRGSQSENFTETWDRKLP